MATGATAAAVPVLRDRAVLATDVSALTVEIISMTGGTVRLVSRKWPADGFRVRLVARGAQQIRAVVERLVAQTRVHEVVGQPRDRVMTLIALPGCDEMPRTLAGRRYAVMAGRARAQYVVVVDGGRRYPDRRGVAILTDIRRQDMRWRLARNLDVVMTGYAVVHDADMVESGRYPRDGGMAIITRIAALNVSRVLAGGDGAVVAGAAGTDDLGVIDGVGGDPQRRVVAVLADVGGVDVCGALAGGGNAVVAGSAVTGDAGVVEHGRDPGRCRVAVVTGVAALNVGRMLAGGDGAIVAGATGTDDLGVIDGVGRCPGVTVMTVVTGIGCLDMGQVFASRDDAIVAGPAGTDGLGMIDAVGG